jgi:hypothetical protein
MPARDKQIGERTDHDQAMSILFEPAVAHLGKAKHPLDNPDRMLNLGPHLRFRPVFRALDFVHDAAMAVAAIGEVPRLGGALADHCPLTAIRLVAPYGGFVAVQQAGQHRAVGDIGRRRHDRVDQLAAAVDPKISFHPDVPLVSLLRLMHLGVSGLVGILRRGRRIDYRGINDCAGGRLKSVCRQVPLHLVEQPAAEIVLLNGRASRQGSYALPSVVRRRLASELRRRPVSSSCSCRCGR